MKLPQAEMIAKKWVARLSPECERIEIAGSVRRRKDEPKDIEIVCISKVKPVLDLFGNKSGEIAAVDGAVDLWLVNAFATAKKNGHRYKQLVLPEGINLDLFIVRPETWAVQFAIRTGPAEFSHWLVTSRRYGGALPSHCQVKDGQVWQGDQPVALQEEKDFFDFLGLGWMEPWERKIK